MIALDETWNAFSGLHGGLVVAWLLEEAAATTHQQATSITTHFLRPVHNAPAEVSAELVHAGRTTSSAVVRLQQSQRLGAHAIASFGELAEATGWDSVKDLTSLPSPGKVTAFEPPVTFVPFAQHVDIRPVGGSLPGSGGPVPAYEAWIRFRERPVADELGPWGAAAVLLDAMPPGMLGIWSAPRAVPTVELSMHFAPAVLASTPWWHISHRTRWASATSCVDETTLSLPEGAVVAQARQHRRIV